MITPTRDNPKLTFIVLMITGREEGITSKKRMCFLVPPRVWMSLIFSVSVSMKPVYILSIAPKTATDTAATIIVLTSLPSHTMRTGASADFGRLFHSTKQGSNTSKIPRHHHMREAVKKATPITMAKQMRVSYIVIHIWRYIIPSSESFTKHLIILPGLLNINESMRPVLVVISHNAINATARKILREMIVMWCIFCFAIYFL